MPDDKIIPFERRNIDPDKSVYPFPVGNDFTGSTMEIGDEDWPGDTWERLTERLRIEAEEELVKSWLANKENLF